MSFRSPFSSIADRSRFFKILVRILATSIGPILVINLVLNLILFSAAKERFVSQQAGRLSMLAASTDERMKNIESAAVVLGRNDDVTAFIVDPDKADFTRNSRVLNLINDYVAAHDLISSIYIYSAEEGLVIASNGGVADLRSFYDSGWLDDFKKPYLGYHRMRTRAAADRNGKTTSVLTLLRNLPIGSFGKTAALIVNLKEDALLSRAGGMERKDSATYIIDSEGYLISHPDKTRIGEYAGDGSLYAEALRYGSGSAVRKTRDGVRFVAYAAGEYTHWVFVNETPTGDLVAVTRGTLFINFTIVLFAVAAMLLIGFRFSKELYLPFEELQDTNRLFENAKPMMVQNLLFNLLHDRLSDDKEIAAALRIVGEEMPHPLFTVFVFEIDGYENLREQRDRISLGFLKRALLERLAESLPENTKHLYGEIDDDRLCLLLNHDPRSEEDERDVRADVGDTFVSSVPGNFPFTVTCGVGESYGEITNVYRSFSEACYAVQNKLFQGCGKTIVFSEMNAERDSPLVISSSAEKELLTHVRLGRTEGIPPLVDTLIADVRGHKPKEIATARRVFDRIAGALAAIDPSRDLLEELQRLETIEAIRSWLVETCTSIAGKIEEQRVRSIGAAAERVAAYIEANFLNQNISLIDIGDAVGLSPSYVSRVFKERYGMNYVDFLNGRRLERAKSLLRETGLSINEIGVRSGFSNMQTFSRVFKKHEKTTPGQYRSDGGQPEAGQ